MSRIATLLIANRGEIACRIARTARALGIAPVGVYSEADATAWHVRAIGRSVLIGAGPAAESYLRVDAVLDAARRVGADAIHPGYGFLSENAAFAAAVEAAGLIFVGPDAATLSRFGDKASAKRAAVEAGLPVVPGVDGTHADPDDIARAVLRMGLPALLKAVGGGGGRGQRLVEDEATLAGDIAAALREARSAFGSEGLLVERYLPHARHVEIQIVGDGDGQVLHLFERDCTLQRRHQKVIEEAPAWGLPAALLERMAADAVRLGQSVRYRGLATVEFLVADGAYYFLEVNPRIQVEHPVTEAVTGLDLVALQLRIAQGEGLGLRQEQVSRRGHAIEARLYAEDPAQSFAPSTGRINRLRLPDDAGANGIRVDTGVAEGDSVTPFYDPMIAKLTVHAADRATALAQLARALDSVAVDGVTTNRDFLRALARDAEVAAMAIHTRWIDARLHALIKPEAGGCDRLWQALAAVLFVMTGRVPGSADPWRNRERFTGWRLGLGGDVQEAGQRVTLSAPGLPAEELRVGPLGEGGRVVVHAPGQPPLAFDATEIAPGRWRVAHAGDAFVVGARAGGGLVEIDAPDGTLLFEAAPPLAFAAGEAAADHVLVSPLTGLISRVLVREGDVVATGQTVAILESMKLEISIRAAVTGAATRVLVAEGAMVERGQPVVEIMPEGDGQ